MLEKIIGSFSLLCCDFVHVRVLIVYNWTAIIELRANITVMLVNPNWNEEKGTR